MKRHRFTFAVAAVALVGALAATALASTAVVKPALTVRVVGQGRVTSSPRGIACPAACRAAFKRGASVRLTAHPASGWEFSAWSGACKGAGSCAVKLASAKAVRATFVLVPPTVPPPPAPAATPGHYVGTTGDNELWTFDIGADGISLSNLQTGQVNESCEPPDFTLAGGNLSFGGPFPVALDGSFTISTTLTGTVGGDPSTDKIVITGHVANGSASGTYRDDTSFTDNGTAYGCTSGTQAWTASKT
jgi:hypothetical protein